MATAGSRSVFHSRLLPTEKEETLAAEKPTNVFNAGQAIIRENSPGDSAYIILKGKVQVTKIIDGQKVVLDTLGPGSIFGEMSLLDGRPRSATVTAVAPTVLSIVDSRRFQSILNSMPREVRPLFASLSDRLRHTSQLVSVLNQRERLLYSASMLAYSICGSKGDSRERGKAVKLRDLVYESCRVLAVDHVKIEEVLVALADTSLALVEKAEKSDERIFVITDIEFFAGFIDYLSEKLSYIPGFPLPAHKYSVLSSKAQEVLFHLKNVAGMLPNDKDGNSHYDFDLYVKQSVASLGIGVKEAILSLQSLSAGGHVKLNKFSEVVQNKAIVYRHADISQAQLILLQSEEFDKIYRKLTAQ